MTSDSTWTKDADTLDTAEYEVVQLGYAISALERRAQSESGRDELSREGGELIDIKRRFYALMWTLNLVIKNAA